MPQLKWSCDEKDKNECRNPHGCHCREITELLHRADSISKLNHHRAKVIDQIRSLVTVKIG